MTPDPLDEIQARVTADRLCQQETCDSYTCQTSKDRAALVGALRAVEAVHVPEPTLWGKSNCAVCADWDDSQVGEGPPNVEWPCPTITAIREALG